MNVKREAAISAMHTLKEYLRNERPQWTLERPTAEGFYWLRLGGKSSTMVVHIHFDLSMTYPRLVVQIGEPGVGLAAELRNFCGCQWAGPIEMPAN
jgi:hypothetical protein